MQVDRYGSALPMLTAALLAGCRGDALTDATPAAEAPTSGATAALAGSWRTLPDHPGDLSGAASASTTNPSTLRSKVYVIGGLTARLAGAGRITDVVRVYDVTARTWSKVAPLPVRLTLSNGAVEIGGKIYISGGFSRFWDEDAQVWRFTVERSLYVYDPAANRWTRKRDMPIDNSGGSSSVYQGNLYVHSSCLEETYCGAAYARGALWRYEPARDRWTLLGFSQNDEGPGGGFIGGKLYSVASNGLMDIYDPVARTWSSGPRAFTRFCAMPSTTFQAKLYLIGCADDESMLVFDPKTGAWTKAAPRPKVNDWGPLSRVVLNGQPRLHMVGGDRPGNNFLFTP